MTSMGLVMPPSHIFCQMASTLLFVAPVIIATRPFFESFSIVLMRTRGRIPFSESFRRNAAIIFQCMVKDRIGRCAAHAVWGFPPSCCAVAPPASYSSMGTQLPSMSHTHASASVKEKNVSVGSSGPS